MKQPALPHADVAPGIAVMLGQMLELAMILRGRRKNRGALELISTRGRDRAGPRRACHRRSSGPARREPPGHRRIHAGGQRGGRRHAVQNEIGFLRRAHPEPEPFKLEEFAEFARSLGLVIDQPQSRFELQRVLEQTIGSPEEYAVHYGLLRSLKQAAYTPEPEPHYALASEDYCHFTSPIRRYPDLQVHRQLIDWLEGKKPKEHHDELYALGQHCTRTERRAEAAERDLIRVKLLAYLEERLGQSFHAIIVGVEDFGLFCRLAELPVDGLIHVSSLRDDYYYLEPGTHTLVGRRSGRRHRLGDRELVRVAHVDVDRRVLDLTLADSSDSKVYDAPVDRRRSSIPAGPTRRIVPDGRARRNESPQDQGGGPEALQGPQKERQRAGRRRRESPARKSKQLRRPLPRLASVEWRCCVRQPNRFRGR